MIRALYLFVAAALCSPKKSEAEDFLLLSVCLSYWPLVSINYTRNEQRPKGGKRLFRIINFIFELFHCSEFLTKKKETKKFIVVKMRRIFFYYFIETVAFGWTEARFDFFTDDCPSSLICDKKTLSLRHCFSTSFKRKKKGFSNNSSWRFNKFFFLLFRLRRALPWMSFDKCSSSSPLHCAFH